VNSVQGKAGSADADRRTVAALGSNRCVATAERGKAEQERNNNEGSHVCNPKLPRRDVSRAVAIYNVKDEQMAVNAAVRSTSRRVDRHRRWRDNRRALH